MTNEIRSNGSLVRRLCSEPLCASSVTFHVPRRATFTAVYLGIFPRSCDMSPVPHPCAIESRHIKPTRTQSEPTGRAATLPPCECLSSYESRLATPLEHRPPPAPRGATGCTDAPVGRGMCREECSIERLQWPSHSHCLPRHSCDHGTPRSMWASASITSEDSRRQRAVLQKLEQLPKPKT